MFGGRASCEAGEAAGETASNAYSTIFVAALEALGVTPVGS